MLSSVFFCPFFLVVSKFCLIGPRIYPRTVRIDLYYPTHIPGPLYMLPSFLSHSHFPILSVVLSLYHLFCLFLDLPFGRTTPRLDAPLSLPWACVMPFRACKLPSSFQISCFSFNRCRLVEENQFHTSESHPTCSLGNTFLIPSPNLSKYFAIASTPRSYHHRLDRVPKKWEEDKCASAENCQQRTVSISSGSLRNLHSFLFVPSLLSIFQHCQFSVGSLVVRNPIPSVLLPFLT